MGIIAITIHPNEDFPRHLLIKRGLQKLGNRIYLVIPHGIEVTYHPETIGEEALVIYTIDEDSPALQTIIVTDSSARDNSKETTSNVISYNRGVDF